MVPRRPDENVTRFADPHPLRLRNFRLLFIGRTLSTLSEALVPAALSIAVVLATGSAAAMGITLACATIPRVALMPLGGVLADRFQARRMAMGADLMRVATQTFVGVELLSASPVLWHICVAQTLYGVASAFSMPALSPLVVGTVPESSRQRANAVMGFTKGAAWVLGPALAGTLIYLVGSGGVFVLDGMAFAVSAGLLAMTTVRHLPSAPQTLRADLAQGWREVITRPWLWGSLIAHSIWNFAAGILMTLGPVIAIVHLGGEATWLLVLQAGGIGLLIGALLSGRQRLRRPVMWANLGGATYAIPLLLFAIHAPVFLIIIGYGIAQAGLGFLNPIWSTAVQQQVPADRLARVDSYDWLFSLAAQPLGYVVAPLLAAWWNPSVPLTGAAVLVAVACVFASMIPSVRALTSRAPSKESSPIPNTVSNG
ncbi:MFS transporter [Nocardia sp. NBC_01499]|uniref:MFS transporter n=1 Tax=Nocardia sp. NBC_01499 TaxID=2903597 RepID=UPI00386C5029